MSLVQDTLVIYKREMLLFRSNLRTNIIRSIMFPLVFIVFLGNLGNTPSNIPVAIVNLAGNVQSQQFISALSQQNALSVKAITTQQQAINMLDSDQVNVVIIILPQFNGQVQNAPTIDVYYLNQQLSLGNSLQFITSTAQKFNSQVSSVQQKAYLPGAAAGSAQISFTPTYGTSSSYRDFLTGSVVVMVAVFGATFGGGMSIIMDRQLGNLKAFLITPINKNAIVFGKLLYGATTAVLYSMFALLIGLAFGVTVAMGIAGLLWIIPIVILTSFGFTGLTIVLASRINRIEVYTIAAQAISMPIWFISGAFFPTSSMPGWLQAVSAVDPLTYATNGVRDVIINGSYPLGAAAFNIFVQLAFIGIMVYLGMRMFRGTIEEGK
ncbi:MAG: ABC transporter permease [Candidatus Micrarchaeota archaeon]|nr:ABC transporter permease [Candidatus Micrarchaeota archaeon]